MRSAVLLASLLALTTHPVAAQNLIPGASFDTSGDLTANWGNLSPTTIWSSDDVDASPTSGSVRLSNESAPTTGILIQSACVPVTPGATYAYGGWQRTPDLQVAEGSASVFVQFRESCPAGAFVGGDVFEGSSVTGNWSLIEAEFVTPANATGARLLPRVIKTAGEPTDAFVVHFDDVFLPEPGPLANAFAALGALFALQQPRRGSSTDR